jgi:hypothetical protein
MLTNLLGGTAGFSIPEHNDIRIVLIADNTRLGPLGCLLAFMHKTVVRANPGFNFWNTPQSPDTRGYLLNEMVSHGIGWLKVRE